MTDTSRHLYLLGLGSNQRHHLLGNPASILRHAIDAMEMEDISVYSASSIITNRPVGPSQRQYANAAAIVETALSPPVLLSRLKSLEAHFGRRQSGEKWRARALDLDILLWSGGMWNSDNPALFIPHTEMQSRPFALQPAAEIAGNWRDPVSGLQIKFLLKRINRAKPLDPTRRAD